MEQKQTKTPKKPYAPPRITVLGDIQTITLGTSAGDFTDAAFPTHTKVTDLTFS